MTSFSDFKLLHSLQRTLAHKNLVTPTEIQRLVIPALLNGKTVVGVAQTGTGKTLAYALPVLHKLKTLENEGQPVSIESYPRAAIIVPTRELGEQVSRVFKLFTHNTRLRVRSVLGGTTMEVAKKNVKGCFEVLVATPGRLLQLMDRELVFLSDVRFLAFDEADQMLDPSFLPDATRIVGSCPPERQLALFSATVPSSVKNLMTKLFSGAEVVRSRTANQLVPTLQTKNRTVLKGVRFPVLEAELRKPVEGGTLIFVNTRQQCDELAQQLKATGRGCVVYRGEMDKVNRRANLKAFREEKVELLISTDLASRGLDVDHVSRVINYHLPQTMDNYIHRVGRTARAGRTGSVINLVTDRDLPLIKEVQRIKEEGHTRA